MPTFPAAGDRLNALTKPGSLTEAHSRWHGRTMDMQENVKAYGAVGDGVVDDTAAIQAAIDAAASANRMVFCPPGSYKLTDNVGLTVAENSRISGSGRDTCSFSVKNAYAFNGVDKGGVEIDHLAVTVRSGATSGGAVKLDSTSQSRLTDISCTSVSTCLTPGIYLKGTIGSHIDKCQIQGMSADGIHMDTTGGTLAFCNANSVYRSRVNLVQGATNAGIYTAGTGNRIRDCIIESNRGYGIKIDGSLWDVVSGCWFEDNSNHNLYLPQTYGAQITENKFHYNHGDIGTADHINLTGTAAQKAMNRIEGNSFQDVSSSGVYVRIGAGTEYTAVVFNRGASLRAGNIVDGGSYSWIEGNEGSTFGDYIKHPSAANHVSRYNTKWLTAGADSGGDPDSAETVFAIRDSTDTNYFMIPSRGYPVFRTGAAPSGSDWQTNSFTFYWDNAAGQIKALVRKNDGSFTTLVVA